MDSTLKVTIHDTNIDRTEDGYDPKWLKTDIYKTFLNHPQVEQSDLIGINDCFGYRVGILGIFLTGLIWVFNQLPFFRRMSKYLFTLKICEGCYFGIWHRDPKNAIANHLAIKDDYLTIVAPFKRSQENFEDSGIMVLIKKKSQMRLNSHRYIPFTQNDFSECGFVAISLCLNGKDILWIHARIASRPALKIKAFLRGLWTTKAKEDFISKIQRSEGDELRQFVDEHQKSSELIFSGDLNMTHLSNPILQEIIAALKLQPGRKIITDIRDDNKPARDTNTYLLISQGLQYQTYTTLPKASFKNGESRVLYTELVVKAQTDEH